MKNIINIILILHRTYNRVKEFITLFKLRIQSLLMDYLIFSVIAVLKVVLLLVVLSILEIWLYLYVLYPVDGICCCDLHDTVSFLIEAEADDMKHLVDDMRNLNIAEVNRILYEIHRFERSDLERFIVINCNVHIEMYNCIIDHMDSLNRRHVERIIYVIEKVHRKKDDGTVDILYRFDFEGLKKFLYEGLKKLVDELNYVNNNLHLLNRKQLEDIAIELRKYYPSFWKGTQWGDDELGKEIFDFFNRNSK